MYRSEAIDALFGRVGFRNSTEIGYADLVEGDNLNSRSNRHFDEFHAIVTIPNIKDIANNDVSISAANFNKYLKDLQTASIASVLAGVFSKPELIEQQMVFERDYERPQVIPNAGKFVGYMVQVANRTNIAVQLNSLSLFFDGAGEFNVYVFNHLTKEAIKTIPVTVSANEEVVVNITDVNMSAIGPTNKSRMFFIGYFQDDIEALGIHALDYGNRLHRTGLCYCANGIETSISEDMYFNRFNPPITGRSYGINMEMSSGKDYTEVILKNQQVFDKAIGLQMAAMVIERIIHSTRSNIHQRLGEEGVRQLYTDLNLAFATPEFPYTTGIKNQIKRETERIFQNFFPKGRIKSITLPSGECSIQKRPL